MTSADIYRYKDGGELDLSDEEKFGGGTVVNPSLFIKNASRRDAGRYRCEVANSVGVGTADNQAAVHVHCEYWSIIWPTELSVAVAGVRCLLLHHDWWTRDLFYQGRRHEILTRGTGSGAANLLTPKF